MYAIKKYYSKVISKIENRLKVFVTLIVGLYLASVYIVRLVIILNS